jgi:uncharacterized SAM-binding protein YcdF (DUF218 family)
MDFAFGKFLGALSAPIFFLSVISVLAALAQMMFRQGRGGRLAQRVLIAAGLLWGTITLTPLGDWLLYPLETRFARPDPMPGTVAGLIILGGVVNSSASQTWGTPILNEEAERLAVIPDLARRYPRALIFFAGGSGDAARPDAVEAPWAESLLLAWGVDPQRLRLEDRSRSTWENALYLQPLLDAASAEHTEQEQGTGYRPPWLLVTSAAHMPRAVGIFRRLGIACVPFPVGPRARHPDVMASFLDAAENIQKVDRAVYEYRGLLAYRLLGRTSSLLPGPVRATP